MEESQPTKDSEHHLKSPIRVIVTGVTGTLGAEVLDQCLAEPRIEGVTALVRKDLNISNSKLTVVKMDDFKDYSKIEEKIKNHHACYWCLGVSTTKVSNEQQYREITLEYALSAAKAMSNANPNFNFYFVSGRGSDPTMKSRLLFARVKGETEVRLAELGIPRLLIWRPGWIKPLRQRDFTVTEKIGNILGHVISPAVPHTDGIEMAKAMIWASFHPVDTPILENKEIKKLAAMEREENKHQGKEEKK